MKPNARIRRGKPAERIKGFTLVELLVGAAVLVTAVGGILISYLRSMELSEVSRNSSRAVHQARNRMELIRSTDFDQIFNNYNNVSFTVTDLNGRGVSYVDNSNPNILTVTVSVSWRQKNGRLFGEDSNLNGVLDAGEDTNGNGILDSPVILVSQIYDRT